VRREHSTGTGSVISCDDRSSPFGNCGNLRVGRPRVGCARTNVPSTSQRYREITPRQGCACQAESAFAQLCRAATTPRTLQGDTCPFRSKGATRGLDNRRRTLQTTATDAGCLLECNERRPAVSVRVAREVHNAELKHVYRARGTGLGRPYHACWLGQRVLRVHSDGDGEVVTGRRRHGLATEAPGRERDLHDRRTNVAFRVALDVNSRGEWRTNG
jgi:hypothetical protein